MKVRAAVRKGRSRVDVFIIEAEGWGGREKGVEKIEKPTRREFGALFGSS